MLFIVLILVLAALGVLIAALVTSKSLFAWVSIGLSVAAALALFVDWVKRRRAERRAAAGGAEPEAEAKEQPAAPSAEAEQEERAEAGEKAEQQAEQPAGDEKTSEAEPAQRDQPATAVATTGAAQRAELPADMPGEEETDAADLLLVAESSAEVIVIDEQPRYHLNECDWLADKVTIPIAVSEARELGFTPCARCGPDARFAEQARRKRVADKS